jgi:hypothetical protein
MTNFLPYKAMCEEKHSEIDSSKCAISYLFSHNHDSFDKFNHPSRVEGQKQTFNPEFVYWRFDHTFNIAFHHGI